MIKHHLMGLLRTEQPHVLSLWPHMPFFVFLAAAKIADVMGLFL